MKLENENEIYYNLAQRQLFFLPRISFRESFRDPSAESFRGSFRGILPQNLATIEEIVPQNPSADPSENPSAEVATLKKLFLS